MKTLEAYQKIQDKISWGYQATSPKFPGHIHEGLDYVDQPICFYNGIIDLDLNFENGAGKMFRVKSKFKTENQKIDFFHEYQHLKRKFFKKKENVKVGDILGEMGSTGNSTGDHVHYQEFCISKNKRSIPAGILLLFNNKIITKIELILKQINSNLFYWKVPPLSFYKLGKK